MVCGFMQNHAGPKNMCKKTTRKAKGGGTPSFDIIFYFGEPP